MFPTLFGDAIFVPSPVITNRILNSDLRQEIMDKRMNSIHQSLKLIYGLFFGIFHLFKEPQKFHLFNQGELSYRTENGWILLVKLLHMSKWERCYLLFWYTAPSIEEYLPLNKDIPPYVHFTLNEDYQYIH